MIPLIRGQSGGALRGTAAPELVLACGVLRCPLDHILRPWPHALVGAAASQPHGYSAIGAHRTLSRAAATALSLYHVPPHTCGSVERSRRSIASFPRKTVTRKRARFDLIVLAALAPAYLRPHVWPARASVHHRRVAPHSCWARAAANGLLAEGVGFEPTIRFPVYTLSKRAP